MRWFKHLTNASDDEVLVEALHTHGHVAYAMWWIVLERIATHMTTKTDRCAARYPMSRWASYAHTSRGKVEQVSRFFETRGRWILTRDGEMLEIECPNLLKFRDEYTSRVGTLSGEAPESVGSLSGLPLKQKQKQIQKQNTDTEKEEDCSNGKMPSEPTPIPEAFKQTLNALQHVKLQNPGSLLEAWVKAYPDVNLSSELLKADAWAASKRVKRSPKGWARTLNNWLSKEQDRAKGGHNGNWKNGGGNPAHHAGYATPSETIERILD